MNHLVFLHQYCFRFNWDTIFIFIFKILFNQNKNIRRGRIKRLSPIRFKLHLNLKFWRHRAVRCITTMNYSSYYIVYIIDASTGYIKNRRVEHYVVNYYSIMAVVSFSYEMHLGMGRHSFSLFVCVVKREDWKKKKKKFSWAIKK